MDLQEAMKILGISDISKLEAEHIRKLYRIKIKKVHPDLGGNSEDTIRLNKAYKLLIKSSRKLQEYTEYTNAKYPHRDTIELRLNQLINIYSGESVKTIRYGDNTIVEVDRKSILRNRVVIPIKVTVKINDNGTVTERLIERRLIYNSRDIYDIDINLNELDIQIGSMIEVDVGVGKQGIKSIAILDKFIIFTMTLDYNIKLVMRLSITNLK